MTRPALWYVLGGVKEVWYFTLLLGLSVSIYTLFKVWTKKAKILYQILPHYCSFLSFPQFAYYSQGQKSKWCGLTYDVIADSLAEHSDENPQNHIQLYTTALWQICDKNDVTPGFTAFLCRSEAYKSRTIQWKIIPKAHFEKSQKFIIFSFILHKEFFQYGLFF